MARWSPVHLNDHAFIDLDVSPLHSDPAPERTSENVSDPLPTLPFLRQFQRLDGSSPEFPDQLSNILYGQGYQQCVSGLQDDDLVRLVDYLDNVCVVLPSLFST